MSNPLWEFAVARYAHESVASACLRAQDEAGSDVNLLLYAAWLAEQECELCPRRLAAVDATLLSWRTRVIAPLRQLRRDWKDLAEVEPLRREIKSLELRAEQLEVEKLWDAHLAAPIQPTSDDNLRRNLLLVLALTCSDRAQQESVCAQLEAALAYSSPN
ncbi:MAG: TIGR02444 family protein [Halioglobus sp.]